MVERALVCPPRSRLTPLSTEERAAAIRRSVLFGHYEKTVDRESAYEKLKARAEQQETNEAASPSGRGRSAQPQSETSKMISAMTKSAAHAIGSQIGRQIIRGVLGSLFGGGKRR